MARRRLRTALWTVVAVVGLGIYLRVVGIGAVVDALGGVSPSDAATLVAAGFVPIVCWGLALHLVLRRLGATVTVSLSVALFAASSFLNSVTPFGQAGGDPPSGLLAARVGDVAFERGFAGVVTVSAANNVALAALGLGAGSVLLATTAADGGLSVAVAVAAGTATVGVVAAAVAWRRRERLAGVVGGALGRAFGTVGRVVPGVDPPDPATVTGRVEGFVAALERLAGDRRRLGAVVGLGACGHLAVAATLALALRAVGGTAPAVAVVAVVPPARLAGLSPTPGGTASAEALLTGLLVVVAGVATPTAAAAALVYRAAAFWIPTLVGGVATAGVAAGG